MIAGIFMAILEGKLGDARVIELANSFATVQSLWTLKCLKIRPMLKIDIGGKRIASKRIRNIRFRAGLSFVPLRIVSLCEGWDLQILGLIIYADSIKPFKL